MRILHYFLGFPPYRTGGLTKYAYDLMREQVDDKNDVIALWPGRMSAILTTKMRYKESIMGIVSYELINPLPVSLDEGICNIDAYMKTCNVGIYQKFLAALKPDVIHIHTLMGLHKEFIEAAEKLKIRTVFTTHDYFGICPKVTLYKCGQACEDDHGCIDCVQCNVNALSLGKIKLMQSPLYRSLKETVIIKKLRRNHRAAFFKEDELPAMPKADSALLADRYKQLRTYYLEFLQRVDMIHFNSLLTEAVYKRYFTPKDSRVISLSHKGIKDNRNTGNWHYEERLRITCLAPAKPFKGFTVLKSVLDELWSEGYCRFVLNIYSQVNAPSPYMRVHENGFSHDKLGEIMSVTDILVAPSIWYETFGFTVLEALSYGVPVIVSDHVGAKDIIGQGGIIVEAGNKDQLKQVILSLTKEKQIALRNGIAENVSIKTWRMLVDETYQLYLGRAEPSTSHCK